FGLVLGEALVVAVLGTGIGLGAGVLLGRGLVRLGTQTINDLYFVVSGGAPGPPRRLPWGLSSASGPRSWRRWSPRSRPPRRRRVPPSSARTWRPGCGARRRAPPRWEAACGL